MSRHRIGRAALSLLVILWSSQSPALAAPEQLSNGVLRIQASPLTGTWSLFREDRGEVIVAAAHAALRWSHGPLPVTTSSSAYPVVRFERSDFTDQFGAGAQLVTHYTGLPGVPDLDLTWRLNEGAEFVRVRAAASAGPLLPFRVWDIWPARAEQLRQGALYVGEKPGSQRLLEHGTLRFADYLTRVVAGTTPTWANWVLAFHDLESDATLVAGFLTNRYGVPALRTMANPPAPPIDRPTGRRGFSLFSAKVPFNPAKRVRAGETIESGWLCLDPISDSAHEGLEEYARRRALTQGRPQWPAPVPTGWNSWGGGSGEGGYGTNINEELMLASLDFMAENFRDWGMDYFQVDDGWEITEGDWEANDDFPHGMAWLAEEIRARDMIPGLWIAPHVADLESGLYREHPEWFLRKSALGRLAIPEEWGILDGSNPEVQDWTRSLLHKLAQQWGYKWIKLDFGYWTLFGDGHYDPNVTREEAYRSLSVAAREGCGDNTFLLEVAPGLLISDLADGARLTLDNTPRWRIDGANRLGEQSVTATYRVSARRYWMHRNLWINHPDVIFFREPATATESRTWTSAIGLMGGIVKLGDKVLEMTPEQVDVIHKVLPVVDPELSRPVDLFERDLPEVWNMRLERGWGGWNVVGLFNWGRNRDLVEREPIEEAARVVSRDLADLGLDPSDPHLAYEFWSGELLGVVSGRIETEVEPRDCKLVALRPLPDPPRPCYLGSDRHVTMGGAELLSLRWDKTRRVLAAKQKAVPGYREGIAIHLPAGFVPSDLGARGAELAMEQQGEVLRLVLDPTREVVGWAVRFAEREGG